jgi:hypothetical protein
MLKALQIAAFLAAVLLLAGLGSANAGAQDAEEFTATTIWDAYQYAAETAKKAGKAYVGLPTFKVNGPKQSMGVLILDPDVVDRKWVRHQDLGLSLSDLLERPWTTHTALNRYIVNHGSRREKFVAAFWSGRKRGSLIEIVRVKKEAGHRTDIKKEELGRTRNIGVIGFHLCENELDPEYLGGFSVGEQNKEEFGVVRLRRKYVVASVNP